MAVVLITGCSSGFGYLTTLEFASRGYTVVATMRDLASSDRLKSELAAADGPVDCVQLDAAAPESIDKAVAQTLDKYGGIDILVNNAGMGVAGPVESLPWAAVDEMFATNVFGLVHVTRAILPSMRERRSGVIVNVASMAGRLPGIPGNGFYSASKHAAVAISDALIDEVRPLGITVRVVVPGVFDTEMLRKPSPRLDACSPYAAILRQVRRGFAAQLRSPGDPRLVARHIVEVATSDGGPSHTVIGADAVEEISAFETYGHEGYLSERRRRLGLSGASTHPRVPGS